MSYYTYMWDIYFVINKKVCKTIRKLHKKWYTLEVRSRKLITHDSINKLFFSKLLLGYLDDSFSPVKWHLKANIAMETFHGNFSPHQGRHFNEYLALRFAAWVLIIMNIIIEKALDI